MIYNLDMKLDEELIKTFAKEIEDGLPFKYTCHLLEITEQIANTWIRQGESDKEHEVKSIYALFFSSIKKAYAKFLRTCKCKINKGESGWQGTAWWLERTNKDFQINNDAGDVVEPVVVKSDMKRNKNGTKCE